jgi:hypothetical protein
MSISALTTLAAARGAGQPTKRDVGKATSADAEKDDKPSITDLLATAIPTEVVAPYTAVMAVIVGAVADPTTAVPNPDQLTLYRWIAFALLLFLTTIFVWRGKQRKRNGRVPVLEICAAASAAAGWALALPGSPLTPYLDDTAEAVVPALIAFGAIGVVAAFGGKLGDQATKA